jgi:hypothetical protein
MGVLLGDFFGCTAGERCKDWHRVLAMQRAEAGVEPIARGYRSQCHSEEG